MTNLDVPIVLFTDSKCLFDTITKMSTVSEKRLMIDISALRQSYARGEVFNIGHISSHYNLADPLTKRMKSKLMDEVILCGRLRHPVNQWILHRKGSWKKKGTTKNVTPQQLCERKKGECKNA